MVLLVEVQQESVPLPTGTSEACQNPVMAGSAGTQKDRAVTAKQVRSLSAHFHSPCWCLRFTKPGRNGGEGNLIESASKLALKAKSGWRIMEI